VGDYVDIKVNPAVHKGMPFKFYHGRTGVIWNVTKRALGVELNKTVRPGALRAPCRDAQRRNGADPEALPSQIGNRQIKKRIHVRVEHVQPSRCREDFLARRTSNDIKKAAAKKAGGAPTLKHTLASLASRPALTPCAARPPRAEKADTKRQPVQPREGLVLENVVMTVRCVAQRAASLLQALTRAGLALQTVTAIPYDIVREGIKY